MTAEKAAWNPWPWALIAFFVTLISSIVAYTTFALRQRVDLVGADYYEQEIRYQHQLDRMNRTAAAGAPVGIAFDAVHRRLALTLPTGPAAHPPTGTIHLYRPADARLDRDLALAVDAAGRQEIDAATLAAGLWKVRITWNVGPAGYYQDQSVILPPPTP